MTTTPPAPPLAFRNASARPLPLAARPIERRQPALLRDLEPGPAADLALDGVRADGLGLALDLEVAEVLEDEEALAELLGVPAHRDLPGLGDVQQPGGEVHGVADGGVVHPQVAADGADDHGPGVDPDPHAEVAPVRPLDVRPERREPLLDRQGRPQGAARRDPRGRSARRTAP